MHKYCNLSNEPQQAYLCIVVLGPGDLVAVDGDSSDLSTAGRCNRAHGATHTAAHIQTHLPRP